MHFKTRFFFCSHVLFTYIKTDCLLQDLQNCIPSLHVVCLIRYSSLKCYWRSLDLFVNSNFCTQILVLKEAELSEYLKYLYLLLIMQISYSLFKLG